MHRVNGHDVRGVPEGFEEAWFGMGCFWGVERLFWKTPGVWSTAVGYAGGHKADPNYRAVCGGDTGHAEVVRVVYDPKVISYADLLKLFWENHDPTQGMRQGNDVGSQYRSTIHATTDEQYALAMESQRIYQQAMSEAGRGLITTQIYPMGGIFYFAEDEHQQYLQVHPNGYCNLGGTGVPFPGF